MTATILKLPPQADLEEVFAAEVQGAIHGNTPEADVPLGMYVARSDGGGLRVVLSHGDCSLCGITLTREQARLLALRILKA